MEPGRQVPCSTPTSQRTETPQIARVDLVPQQPKYTEERFEELFKPETPARGARNGSATPEKPAPKPVDINFDDIRSRLTLLPIGLEVNAPQISPDGQTLLVSAEVGGQVNLYLYPLEENRRGPRNERVARQLTSTAAMKGRAQFSLDGKEVFYLEGGRPQVITVESRQSHPVAVTAAGRRPVRQREDGGVRRGVGPASATISMTKRCTVWTGTRCAAPTPL